MNDSESKFAPSNEFDYTYDEDEQSTTSNNWQTALTISKTSLPLGIYRLGVSSEIKSSVADVPISFRIYNTTHSIEINRLDVFTKNGVFEERTKFLFMENLQGDHNIELQFAVDEGGSGSATAYIKKAVMEFWRVKKDN